MGAGSGEGWGGYGTGVSPPERELVSVVGAQEAMF